MANGPNGIYYDLTDGDDVGIFVDNLDTAAIAQLPGGIRALAGNDQVIGGGANDFVFGNQGNDSLFGFSGNDTLWGGRDNDVLIGDGLPSTPSGDDNLNGNLGDDVISGGGGNDLVRGGQGNDALNGNDGIDTIIGDFGQDTLSGGADADLFVLRRDTASTPDASGNLAVDVILDFGNGADIIGLTGGLTEADLQLLEISINTSNGVVASTAINFVENGQIKGLGVVLGKTPGELTGRFGPTAF